MFFARRFIRPISLDLQAFASHVVRLARAGVKPLLAGSMGEAHHLSLEERVVLIKSARTALDENGFESFPIIAGTGGGSTRQTIQLSMEAAQAGADYAIVIASGYFAGVLAGNKKALKAFWQEVSENSPIPVIIYNCESVRSPRVHRSSERSRQIPVQAVESTSTLTSSRSSRRTVATSRE